MLRHRSDSSEKADMRHGRPCDFVDTRAHRGRDQAGRNAFDANPRSARAFVAGSARVWRPRWIANHRGASWIVCRLCFPVVQTPGCKTSARILNKG